MVVIFKWIQSLRPRRDPDVAAEAEEVERDSGEDEYASHEEDDREVAPSGLTRVKTDEI